MNVNVHSIKSTVGLMQLDRHQSIVCSAVLPDAERSHHSYVNMVFDNDPTAEHERLAKLSNKQRRRISGMAPLTCTLPGIVGHAA